MAVPEVCREHPLGCAWVRGLERVIDALAPYPTWLLWAVALMAGLLLCVALIHLRERYTGRGHRHSLATKLTLAIGLPAALVPLFFVAHFLVELTAPAFWLIDRSPVVSLIAVLTPLTLAALVWAIGRSKRSDQRPVRLRDDAHSLWRALRERLRTKTAQDLAAHALTIALFGWIIYSVSLRLTALSLVAFNARPERIDAYVMAQHAPSRYQRDHYLDVSWPGRHWQRIYWPAAWFRPLPDGCVFDAAEPGDRVLLQGRRGWSGFSIDRVLPLNERLRNACADEAR